jgi:hypothetical protein
MAIFKLGAIVTGLVGSIGGTTFRRGANNLVMQRKSFGASRSKLLSNQRLNQIGFIFNQFSTLSPAEQNDWNNLAGTIQFPDKFGVLKYLTGRQLFCKLNCQLLPVNNSVESADGVSTTVLTATLVSAECKAGSQLCAVELNSPIGPTTVMVSATYSTKRVTSPQFISREILAYGEIDGTDFIEMGTVYFQRYPYAVAGAFCQFYFTSINEFGFKSVQQFIEVEIEA